ncbi:MAG: MMPL family transporter [Thermodesulfobacteriota bacterium]|nr:MMPL family transporter [Thermodesulfobacteriota bacterium]
MDLDKINAFFERFAQVTLKYKIFVLIAILAVFVFFVAHIPKMTIITSFESFFVEDDEAIRTYDEFKKEFGNDKTVYILVEPRQGELFTLDNMAVLKKITEDLEKNIPFLDEIVSITNAEFIEGQENTLRVYDLMVDFPKTEKELLQIKKKILDREIYRDSIISKDGEKTGILIKLLLEEDDPDYEKKVAQTVREVFAGDEYQQLKYHEVGAVLFDTEFQTHVRKETMKFFRLSVILIMTLLYFFMRRLYAVYVPLAVVILSVVMTFGLLAMTTSMKVTCTIILPLVVTIGVCDSIYIVSMFRKYFINAGERKKAIVQAMKKCGLPCLITSLTTIMGFLALSAVPIIPVREAGLFCAFGTAMCFIMSITLGIILLSFGKNKADEKKSQMAVKEDIYHRAMTKLADINIKYRRLILAGALILTCFCVYETSTIVTDNNFLAYMGDEFEVKGDIQYVDSRMCGSSTLEVVFDTGVKDGIKDPEVLREIEGLQNFAKKEPLVMATSSVVDVIKTINKTLHNEDPEFYRIPETKNEVAQYLLLYESSGGERLDKVVTFDYEKARLILRTKTVGSRDALPFYENIKNFTDKHIKKSKITITGADALKVRVIDYILQAQITSVLLAFGMITIMMMIVFGSIRTGLITMIPNIFPVIFILGFMGITGRNLGMMNAMISAVAIGIAVDDTIHFFSHYREARRHAKDVTDAFYTTMQEVGRPMFFTSMALTIGFSVVMISSMNNVAEFGVLMSLAVFVSLLSDFFIGSSLILTLKPFEPGE